MGIARNTFALLCLIIGCIWILQGINVLPGSFMTGQRKWAVYGTLLGIAGIALMLWGRRPRP